MIMPLAPEYQSQIDWIYALVCLPAGIVAQSVMCRTTALLQGGGFDNLPAAWGDCDWLTWCKMAKNGAVTSPHLLMHWRADGGNTTSSLSRYWLQQKIEAIYQARPLWKRISESLHPITAIDAYKCDRIKHVMIDEYLSWHPNWTFSQLPVGMYVSEMKRQWQDGDIAFRTFFERAQGRILRGVICPYIRNILRIFYPLVVLTRPWRHRK